MAFGRKILQTFVVVDEDETSTVFRAIRPAQKRVIAFLNILRTWEYGLHRSKQIAPVVHEQMQFPQHVVVRILLSELTEGRLEVVGLHRHVVIVGGWSALHLVEPDLAIGVRATMIHIVAQKVGATAEFHDGHRVGILRIQIRPTVIGRHHATAQFAGEVGILFIVFIQSLFLFT